MRRDGKQTEGVTAHAIACASPLHRFAVTLPQWGRRQVYQNRAVRLIEALEPRS